MFARLNLLKERLSIPAYETGYDKLLEYFIGFTSYRFEKECNRFFKRQENFSEEFPADQTELSVSCYPIESITSIEIKRSEQNGWESIDDAIYIMRYKCIVSLLRPAGSSREQIRITYTGGYVLPDEPCTDGQTPLPSDLEDACIEQAAYFFKNRERLGLVGFAGLRSDYQQMFDYKAEPEGTTDSDVRMFLQFQQIDLLNSVRTILMKYKKRG